MHAHGYGPQQNSTRSAGEASISKKVSSPAETAIPLKPLGITVSKDSLGGTFPGPVPLSDPVRFPVPHPTPPSLPMKPYLHLATVLALFASFAIAPAKEHESDDDDDHEEKEHRVEGQQKKGEKENANKGREGRKGEASAKLPPPSDKQGLTFDKDIAPLFENACVKCHGEDKHKGGIRVDTLAELMKGGEDGAIVVPGNSAKSPLVLSVARVDRESAMPPDRKPGRDIGPDGKKLPPVVHFTAEQVGLIRAWIDQGAK
jgi:hypothetical protein